MLCKPEDLSLDFKHTLKTTGVAGKIPAGRALGLAGQAVNN